MSCGHTVKLHLELIRLSIYSYTSYSKVTERKKENTVIQEKCKLLCFEFPFMYFLVIICIEKIIWLWRTQELNIVKLVLG